MLRVLAGRDVRFVPFAHREWGRFSVNREMGPILYANHGKAPLCDAAEYVNEAGGAGDFDGSSREPPETGFWRRGRDSNPRYPVKDTPD